jgi:hypothetical protein
MHASASSCYYHMVILAAFFVTCDMVTFSSCSYDKSAINGCTASPPAVIIIICEAVMIRYHWLLQFHSGEPLEDLPPQQAPKGG